MDLAVKQKRIRRFFSKSFKDIEDGKEEILIYDMSIKFCDIHQVKESIDVQGKDEITSINLMKKYSVQSIFGESTSVYANRFKKKNPEQIRQFLTYLMSNNNVSENKKKLNLERVTHYILKAVEEEPISSVLMLEEYEYEDVNNENKSLAIVHSENEEGEIPSFSTNDEDSLCSKSPTVITLTPEKVTAQSLKPLIFNRTLSPSKSPSRFFL